MGVALVIPNRNNARYVGQCLESALRQSLSFEEIVVVDDASDDDSREIVRSMMLKSALIRLIPLDQRVGVSRARDTGLRAVQSSHVTTLDSDDYFWSAEKNEREWRLLERADNARRNVIAFSDVRQVAVDGSDLGSWAASRPVREGNLFHWLLGLHGFIPRDFTLPRETYFSVGGYDPAFSLYEDWDLKLRLARLCDFRYTNRDGVAYRQNPLGLSRLPVGAHMAAMVRIAWKNTRDQPEPWRFLVRCHTMGRIGWFLRGAMKRSIWSINPTLRG